MKKSDKKANVEKDRRCINCEYARRIHADTFDFRGCIHEPYNGKWVIEIDECPCGRSVK